MSKFRPYIFGIAVVVIFGILWKQGCLNKPGPDHSSDKKFVDSITIRVKNYRDSLAHSLDSFKWVNSRLNNDKDSLTAIIVSYERTLDKQGNDIGALLSDLNNAEAQRDSALVYVKCDSLKNAVMNAKAAVVYYISSNDSLRRINDKIIANKTEIINRINQQLIDCNNSSFAIGLKYDNLYNDYKKIDKPKRFGIGPSFGCFVTNRGVGYGIGLDLHYDFIKF